MTATIITSTPTYSSSSATVSTSLPIGITSSNTFPYTVTSTVSGSSGQYMYSNGTNPVWVSPNTISTGTYSNNTLHVKGNANFEGDADFAGDVKIKGKSIVDLINNIEQRLAILHPNEKLENKWEDLKKLGDMYRQLEQEIIEKEKMWAILKE